jgi:hypothetical protein
MYLMQAYRRKTNGYWLIQFIIDLVQVNSFQFVFWIDVVDNWFINISETKM